MDQLQFPVFTRYHSQADGGAIIERVQDAEPYMDRANGLRQIGAVGSSEVKHAAHFPAVLVERYIDTNGITFEEFIANPEHVKRMCNDPALAAFRVWEGKV